MRYEDYLAAFDDVIVAQHRCSTTEEMQKRGGDTMLVPASKQIFSANLRSAVAI